MALPHAFPEMCFSLLSRTKCLVLDVVLHVLINVLVILLRMSHAKPSISNIEPLNQNNAGPPVLRYSLARNVYFGIRFRTFFAMRIAAFLKMSHAKRSVSINYEISRDEQHRKYRFFKTRPGL